MSSDRFRYCLKIILGAEGGYSNHPADRGGATKWGITQKTLDAWCDRYKQPRIDVRNMHSHVMEDIYDLVYWQACMCQQLPRPIDLAVFDSAVQHGSKRAGKLLQEAIGVVPIDGKIGIMTMKACANLKGKPIDVARAIIALRDLFYRRIVEEDASQRVFFKGWQNRLANLCEAIEKDKYD